VALFRQINMQQMVKSASNLHIRVGGDSLEP
jgi:hypothetical protein